MKITKSRRNNIIFLVLLALLIIPKTRQPIQIVFHKAVSYFNSAKTIEESERVIIENFDWRLIDESNTSFDFNLTKERVVVINFWATWCPPCIVEMQSLEDLYNTYKDEVIFLFVTNDSFDMVSSFKDKHSYTFPVYRPISKPLKEFDVRSIPRTFIINKKGEIVIDKSGAVDWFSDVIKKEIEILLK